MRQTPTRFNSQGSQNKKWPLFINIIFSIMTIDVQQRPNGLMEIRVFWYSVPQDYSTIQNTKKMVVWVAGWHMNGQVIGKIVHQCKNLTSLEIKRKDHEWQGSRNHTYFSWTKDDDMLLANGLRDHPTLQEFSLVGFAKAAPIDKISRALCTITKLVSLELISDFCSKRPRSPSLPAEILHLLLRSLSNQMKMIGVFPETEEYCDILQKAYIQDMCLLQINIRFSDTNSRKPSHFASYLREVMELNQMQMGKRDNCVCSSFLKLASGKGRKFSFNCVFLLLQENPWLCGQNGNCQKRRKKGWAPRKLLWLLKNTEA
uniref:Uncharacterized protein n=1 Tax=Ditylum brightwellii TaxID=49249 RepID=A0A7S4T2V8_9STRA|mmetsp:Transcript_15459/g.22175  ORF Transcript_15459/g.22175 Transcript_15459/m.22175 type:complete len:316 (+) Transcript_15459:5-952(+)